MHTLRWGTALATVVLTVGAVAWWRAPAASSQPPAARQPAALQPTIDHFTDFRTWTFTNPWGVYRVDAERVAFAADVQTKEIPHQATRTGPDSFQLRSGSPPRPLRISWDGTDLYWSRTPLPQVYGDRVAEVWAEARAGFPNTTVVAADPSEVSPDWREYGLGEHRDYYRIDTPWTWDDHVRIYAGFRSGHLADLSVFDPDTGQPLELLGHPLDQVNISTNSLVDVPLDPDVLSHSLPSPWNRHFPRGNWTGHHGGRTQHELPPYHDAIRRVLLDLDTNNSTHDADRYKVSLACAPGSATEDRIDLQLLWAPPTDPETTARLADAQAACDAVDVEMGMKAILTPALPEQTACYDGTWEVIDRSTDPPTVRWQRQVGRCVDGPAREHDPFETTWAMPDTLNLSQIGVRWTGSVRISCTALGAETWGTAHLLFGSWGGAMSRQVVLQPRLTWDCFPGWDTPD